MNDIIKKIVDKYAGNYFSVWVEAYPLTTPYLEFIYIFITKYDGYAQEMIKKVNSKDCFIHDSGIITENFKIPNVLPLESYPMLNVYVVDQDGVKSLGDIKLIG